MDEGFIEELLTIERAGWDSLCNGTGSAFYGGLMTDDGVMILAGGFVLDRPGVVKSLADAPAWSSYEIADVRGVEAGADSAVLVYRGTARRDGEDPFEAWMSSAYVRQGDGWRLAVYQQTPVSV